MTATVLIVTAVGCQLVSARQSRSKRERPHGPVTKEFVSEAELGARLLDKGSYKLDLAGADLDGVLELSLERTADDDEGYLVEVPLRISRVLRHRGWERLRVPGSVAVLRAYRVMHESRLAVVIIWTDGTADWMRDVDDATPLGELCMPGTHESCALYGYPISQCQQPSTPIAQQLLDGVRYLDVRLRVVGDELLMYHGPRPQRSSLPILLDVLHDFLDQHPTETFILCLKEESPPFHPQFSSLVYSYFKPHADRWFLHNRIPKLGEVRGKGILMTRFPDGNKDWIDGLGIHPYTWPDSRREGFEWDCDGTRFRIQDWYRVPTFLEIPEKFQVILAHLEPTLRDAPGHPFSLSYTSASGFPLSFPTIIAKGFGFPSWGLGIYGINTRLLHWLLCRMADGQKVRSCFAIDFYRQADGTEENDIAHVLVSMNSL